MQTVESLLLEIFRQVFDDDSILLRPEMTANDIDGWDSLSHINLIFTVESEFSIKLSRNELLSLKNVGNLMSVIANKTGMTLS